MLALLVAVRPADCITEYPSLVDLHELLALRNVQENTCLWFGAAGQMVAFAIVDHYHNLLYEIEEASAGPAIESEIVAWGVKCVQRAAPERQMAGTLDASCRETDTKRIAFLERNGFLLQTARSLRLVRPLDTPIPAPEMPAGFGIRHVTGEGEVEALVALHQAAFGSANMTVAERLAMMRAPGYDASLDLLAVAPDGRLAAACMCSISPDENALTGRREGYTDPVMTHPDFQRRGLARALLLKGLHELKQRGIDMAVLGTSSDNLAMQQAAQAVGFRISSVTLWYARPVMTI